MHNVSFQKLYQPNAQQWQTRRARTEKNVTAVDELVLSQQDQLNNEEYTLCLKKTTLKTTLMLHTIDFGNFWQRCC